MLADVVALVEIQLHRGQEAVLQWHPDAKVGDGLGKWVWGRRAGS